MRAPKKFFYFFFFNDPPPPEISTLPLHDALPICAARHRGCAGGARGRPPAAPRLQSMRDTAAQTPPAGTRERATGYPNGPSTGWRGLSSCRSEEHTSELQSRLQLLSRLLLEKKKI